jgi:hypothetical protein
MSLNCDDDNVHTSALWRISRGPHLLSLHFISSLNGISPTGVRALVFKPLCVVGENELDDVMSLIRARIKEVLSRQTECWLDGI